MNPTGFLLNDQKADLVANYGEPVSAVLVAGFFRSVGLPAVAVDARDVVGSVANFTNAHYDAAAGRERGYRCRSQGDGLRGGSDSRASRRGL